MEVNPDELNGVYFCEGMHRIALEMVILILASRVNNEGYNLLTEMPTA